MPVNLVDFTVDIDGSVYKSKVGDPVVIQLESEKIRKEKRKKIRSIAKLFLKVEKKYGGV